MMENLSALPEKIYIIQPVFDESESKNLLQEAVSLVESAGCVCAGSISQKIREISPATYIGAGKLSELNTRLSDLDITVLFNGELSPSQTLNISAALDDRKVIDRTTLILDIFARNAKSNEGKLQVELAQLKYNYPRLKGKGAALSRLGGGIGTRGPGETKLETDRRRIRERIDYLEKRLLSLENSRKLIASRRKKDNQRTIALVGYTNTGKSTLLNHLTGASIYAADRLFATLDTTTRIFFIDGKDYLLTDTVGFLRDLPHNLISAFHSTLESALNCDLLLLVCDATGDYTMQMQTTLKTLQELNCDIPHLLVMNKCENISSFDVFPAESIFISAATGAGIEGLKSKIAEFFAKNYTRLHLKIPYSKMNEYAKLKKYLTLYSENFCDDFVDVEADTEKRFSEKFADYRMR